MKRIASLFLAACLLSLFACGPREEGPRNLELTEYQIVVPQGNSAVKDMAETIRDAIKDQTGTKLKVSNDKVSGDADPDQVFEKEILVGMTNRTASAKDRPEASSGGWWVSVEGTRIVVNAGNVKQLQNAVDHFNANLSFVDGKAYFSEEKVGYEMKQDAWIDMGLTLKVATFNIKKGSEVGYDMAQLAQLIKQVDPDIIGLQEVEVNSTRVNGLDTLKLLAEAADYEHYQFIRILDTNGGGYGNAIMSKYPIESFEILPLDVYEGDEARAAGHFVLNVNGAKIDYFNTHFSYKYADFIARQAEQMNEFAQGKQGTIITADFNTASLLSTLSVIENTRLVNGGKYITFPSNKTAIDDIVMDHFWKIVDSGMVESKGLSDHNMVWAEIAYTGGW